MDKFLIKKPRLSTVELEHPQEREVTRKEEQQTKSMLCNMLYHIYDIYLNNLALVRSPPHPANLKNHIDFQNFVIEIMHLISLSLSIYGRQIL